MNSAQRSVRLRRAGQLRLPDGSDRACVMAKNAIVDLGSDFGLGAQEGRLESLFAHRVGWRLQRQV